ncbi:AbrB/MazE/SpoVT family DNA-binding domain-containing protein [Notoacmeibacter sp. MSK16QG-6]|uniref:AbrB/MazE/SpoVT family DNA-binding domain-containing protein n=1 Tax=Notoacmeibacter sp. MSK16QG-6 TaxID=2957982 RepID=UPI00209C7314|nr:AbrB/MazE/SpoVT family DNA-binding domain-containing protein [Notoacmeibacter sp. MSK16QG-6]MCP1198173.1 AbrB/MazE/SpoVT family DNA-binding domain-containing protein [Notoacmeibacter sp. MSK16QG-6]
MNVTIRKIGNSEGIIIPKEVLAELGLNAGDQLSLVRQGEGVRLEPVKADLDKQLEAAREAMAKYRVALRELAK